MRTFQIKKNLRHLNNVEAFVFMHSVQKETEFSSDKDIMMLRDNLERDIEVYKSTLNIKSTQEQTADLKSLYDNLRKKYVELKQIARSVVYFPFSIIAKDAPIREIAAVVNDVVDNITIPKSQSLYTNLGIIKLVISAVHERIQKSVLENSGDDDIIDVIDNLIVRIEDVVAERNDLRAYRKHKVGDARLQAEVSYKLLVDFISLKAEMGDERCQMIVKTINELLAWNGINRCYNITSDCDDDDSENDVITDDSIDSEDDVTDDVMPYGFDAKVAGRDNTSCLDFRGDSAGLS
ncbi:MAG: hypothetical protein IKQ46_07500 [Bacteroidales bacterium]|nr:hypothetical protein [Bacteroidales bacterium]